MTIIVGNITLPFSLSNPERLSWLNIWVDGLKEGLDRYQCIVDLTFSFEDHLNDTFKYFMNDDNFTLVNDTDFMLSNGVVYRLLHDDEAEELLNNLKNEQ